MKNLLNTLKAVAKAIKAAATNDTTSTGHWTNDNAVIMETGSAAAVIWTEII